MTRATEDDLIARYFAPLAAEGGLGLRDDAARLSPVPGHDLVLTVDAIVEGVHFLPGDPPGSIARKALGVNVSDLAAKGAEPVGFLLTLALPEHWTEAWLATFAAGLGEAARDFGCPLLGGDTVRANGALTLSITALGQVPAGRMVPRTTARDGDVLCVTGTIGDATLGLMLRSGPDWAGSLSAEHSTFLADRYVNPQPRIALARSVREHARAAMDVSDGLAGDLAKMMRAGGVSAIVEARSVPLAPAASAALRLDPSLIDRILTGGDDYEILCAVPADRVAQFRAEAQEAGIPFTAIGRVVAGSDGPIFRVDGTEKRYETGSFSHF
jgi:thiamine-monophosphate kinase